MPTHGSLTKAGKVRGQTPKIEGKKRVSPISKLRNKINFVKRFEKRRQPGQRKPERMNRRRWFEVLNLSYSVPFGCQYMIQESGKSRYSERRM